MKLKTKFDKHLNDNEKRRKALSEKVKVKSSQAEIIKQALSTASLHGGKSKKILFDDDDEKSNSERVENFSEEKKTVLFDDSSSEEEKFEIKEKVQFDGKKGFELLKLQSTYGNDDRFKIDKRFLDEDSNEIDDFENRSSLNGENEKTKQLEISDNALGELSAKGKKSKKKTFEMIRYDASNKDHEKYEIKPNKSENEVLKLGKKRKKSNSENVLSSEKKPKIEVSKEKFYKVSRDIKNSFKEKQEESGGFSLLQTYGQNDVDKLERSGEGGPDKVVGDEAQKDADEFLDSFTEIITNAEIVETEKVIMPKKPDSPREAAVVKGIWKESFFFTSNDPRFQEGVSFMNKKNSEEAQAAAEKYDATRKTLKEILRLHNKKQLSKKNPFKNKIGGMNKKQLANSKFKSGGKAFTRKKLLR